jgi:biotin carboxyl carrier protein
MPDKTTSYQVTCNGFEFTFSEAQIAAADLVQKSPVNFHLLKEHQSVNATIMASNLPAKQLTIEVEGESFEITIKDPMDQMLAEMGFDKVAEKQIKEIKAPMPGLVLEIAVAAGDAVNAGDKVIILGAMKMENSITVPASAVVKRIAVAVGQAVEKGQVLVELI